MKKIIAAIDGLKYSESVTKYAIDLAKQTSSHLVGAFLEDFTYHSYREFEVIGNDRVSVETQELLEAQDKEAREESITHFRRDCQEAGVNYSIHHDRNIALRELLHESIYADLLVIDSKETLTHYKENIPTRFVRDLLSEVQCPVLIVPQTYRPINKLVFLYDGEPSSVYAIRTFSYVLPSLKQLETEVVSVKGRSQTGHFPDSRLMREFMTQHYPKADYTVLTGDPEEEIIIHLEEEERNILIVLGAYRRGMVSRWFRPSMADRLMSEVNACLFIAHNK
ncbi:MAG TPA: universal stress protein [Flavitalea sp.]|nr:universal stress protein [Flavitalea sp.]